ncbi:MAG: formate dehydrogenase subunit alpha [Pirellulales bacterium]
MTVQLTIDGRLHSAEPRQSVLDAARSGGIEIPTLCHHPDLSVVGTCRLCVVEIDGYTRQMTACSTPVADGMVVRTESPQLSHSRRFVLEMLLARFAAAEKPGYASGERDKAESEFERWVRRYDAHRPYDVIAPRCQVDSDANPFIRVDWNKCIHCTRCVRACEEIQGRMVWHLAQRGANLEVVAGMGESMLDARCESCGACAAYCPTGALADRMSYGGGPPDRLVTTTCGYCGVGCQFDLNVKDERVIGVTSNPAAAVNGMSLCVKGRYGYDFLDHRERLTQPQVRAYLLEGRAKPATLDAESWVAVDWPTALDLVARRFVAVRQEFGGDALAVLSSAKCTNEENYLLQKFARGVLGTHNVDHCARLCHSSTVAGLAMCYGSGAMSNSMDDVAEQSAAMLIIGSNTTEQHPVFGAMIRQAVLRRGLKLVVADPRRIDITEFAALHVRQRPGTDVALLNGLMHLILQNGWHNERFIRQRCEGFDEFAASLARYTPAYVAALTGVSETQLNQAAELLATNCPMAVLWSMGITQHTTGVMNVLALGNLQMLLGNIGIAGGGVNPLRGQNNVQGACDMGALPNVFPGYQAVTDPAALAKFSVAWKTQCAGDDSARSPARTVESVSTPGLTVTEIIRAAGARKLRGLYIVGEDPAMTEPDSNHARAMLAAAELVVLQEIFPSETSVYADVLLSGAAFAEKDGTFTNTERRVQLVRQAIDPPGDAWADWRITSALAQRILELEGRRAVGPHAGWNYEHPAEIMAEVAALTPSYAGVSHERLARGERLQWPVHDANHPGTPILHVDKFTRGRGKFHVVEHLNAAELPDAEFPLLLTTGRVLYHWHGGELTRRAAGLAAIYPQTLVEVNYEDAARAGLADGDVVRVSSRRGEMIAQAAVSDRVAAGVVFGNFHFPGNANVNNLTIAAVDPVAKIPEYKVCAVRLERVETAE